MLLMFKQDFAQEGANFKWGAKTIQGEQSHIKYKESQFLRGGGRKLNPGSVLNVNFAQVL